MLICLPLYIKITEYMVSELFTRILINKNEDEIIKEAKDSIIIEVKKIIRT